MRLLAQLSASPAPHLLSISMRIACVTLFLLSLLCLLLHDSDAFPLTSWSRTTDRRVPGWLRSWRWLFARKGEDDEQAEESVVKNDQTEASEQSASTGQQYPLTLENFGPGQLMTIGDDLVYVPYSSMKNLNNNPEWVW